MTRLGKVLPGDVKREVVRTDRHRLAPGFYALIAHGPRQRSGGPGSVIAWVTGYAATVFTDKGLNRYKRPLDIKKCPVLYQFSSQEWPSKKKVRIGRDVIRRYHEQQTSKEN